MPDKKRYKIIYDRSGCIGVAACVIMHPDRWVMNKEDDKVDLIGGSLADKDKQEFVLEFTEEEFEKFKQSAEVCPVNVIHIIDLQTGEKII